MDTTEITYIIVLGRTASATIVRPKSVEQVFFLGRTASVTIVRPKSGGNGCTYDLAERYRLMQPICRTRLQRYTFSIKYTIAYDMLYHKKQTIKHSNALITNTWHYRQLSPLRTFCSAMSFVLPSLCMFIMLDCIQLAPPVLQGSARPVAIYLI